MEKHVNLKPLLFSACVTVSLALGLNSISFAVDADNSKENKRIEENAELTSENQSNSDADIKITQRIRQDIVAIDSFSTDAKNIKIITNQGKVTLKGPVASLSEKNRIESIAYKVAGRTRVTSEIKIDTK